MTFLSDNSSTAAIDRRKLGTGWLGFKQHDREAIGEVQQATETSDCGADCVRSNAKETACLPLQTVEQEVIGRARASI